MKLHDGIHKLIMTINDGASDDLNVDHSHGCSLKCSDRCAGSHESLVARVKCATIPITYSSKGNGIKSPRDPVRDPQVPEKHDYLIYSSVSFVI